MLKASRCLLGTLLLLSGQVLAGCEVAGLDPFLRLLPVDQRGLQLRPDPPAPEQATPPVGTGGGGTVGTGGAGSGANGANGAGGVAGAGGAGTAAPTPTPTAAPTPAPLDLLGCEALSTGTPVAVRGVAFTGPATVKLDPDTPAAGLAPADLTGKRYNVELPNGSGIVAITLAEGKGYNVFVNKVLTVTISDMNGSVRQLRGLRPQASCGELANRFPISMPKGTSYLRFAGADEVAISFVLVTD